MQTLLRVSVVSALLIGMVGCSGRRGGNNDHDKASTVSSVEVKTPAELDGKFDDISLSIQGEKVTKKDGKEIKEEYGKEVKNDEFEKDASGSYKNLKLKIPYGTYTFRATFKKEGAEIASTQICEKNPDYADKVAEQIIDQPSESVTVIVCHADGDQEPVGDADVVVDVEVVE